MTDTPASDDLAAIQRQLSRRLMALSCFLGSAEGALAPDVAVSDSWRVARMRQALAECLEKMDSPSSEPST